MRKRTSRARAWYEDQREGLGVRFIANVELALQRIARFPLAATEVAPGVRRVLVPKFPYGVFYDADQIGVTAVCHDRQDPSEWQGRATGS